LPNFDAFIYKKSKFASKSEFIEKFMLQLLAEKPK